MGEGVCLKKAHIPERHSHVNYKSEGRLVNIAKVALETGSGAREESLTWTLGPTGRVRDW